MFRKGNNLHRRRWAIIVHKGPNSEGTNKTLHSHAPNIEEIKALKIENKIKRKAEDHPEAPPAQILRNELRDVPSGKCSLSAVKYLFYVEV